MLTVFELCHVCVLTHTHTVNPDIRGDTVHHNLHPAPFPSLTCVCAQWGCSTSSPIPLLSKRWRGLTGSVLELCVCVCRWSWGWGIRGHWWRGPVKLEYPAMPWGHWVLHLPLLLPNAALALPALSPTLQAEGVTLFLCERGGVCVCVCSVKC